jgi:hypothetical protein
VHIPELVQNHDAFLTGVDGTAGNIGTLRDRAFSGIRANLLGFVPQQWLNWNNP